MSFRNLLGNHVGQILLANLHFLVDEKVLAEDLRDVALRRIYDELTSISAKATDGEIITAFSKAVHVSDPVFLVQSQQWPDEDHRVAMVLDFSRIRAILLQILRRVQSRKPAYAARIRSILRPDARKSVIVDAAAVINELSAGLSELTLNDPNRILWGARADEVESIIADTSADPGLGPAMVARRLRDVLGLVHIKPGRRNLARHLFLFTSKRTLSTIRARPTEFSCARPSTLDGFDNRRFCQTHLRPWDSGWGMTIDIADGKCAVGLPEIVVSPLSLYHFDCRYVGDIKGSSFGPDKEYLAILAPPPPRIEAMAGTLDAMAATR